MDCSDNYLENNFENTAWKQSIKFINAERLQEVLNRIMQGIISIITAQPYNGLGT